MKPSAILRALAVASGVLLWCATAAWATPKSYLSLARVGDRCWGISATAESALDCWLKTHPQVAAAMHYQDSQYNGGAGWATWPAPAQQRLRLYFGQMVAWIHAGMPAKSYPKPFPVYIPKQGPDDPLWGFWLPESLGLRVYLSQAASSLALELTAAVPWTITAYSPANLSLLLNIYDQLVYQSNVAHPGYFLDNAQSLPGPPAYVLTFFKANNLLGQTDADTLGRFFTWERQLTHFYYVGDEPYPDWANIYVYFWGEDGPIRVSSIIEGTTYSSPYSPRVFGHFTAGCGGTQDFMKTVLRAVNIPVEMAWPVCEHATPQFPTVGLAMTHGDDPYDWAAWVTPFQGFSTPLGTDYFVTTAQYTALFPPNQSWQDCEKSVGIHMIDIAIHFASDYLMQLYCEDLAGNASHADGQVFKYLKNYYTLPQLEATPLWTNLDAKVKATGYCALVK